MDKIRRFRLQIMPVKTINGKNFEPMSCEIIFRRRFGKILFSNFAIKRLLSPISEEMEAPAFENVRNEIKCSGLAIFDLKDEASFFDFKGAEETYKIFLHRIKSDVFALLLRRLSLDEENEIKNKEAKLLHIGTKIIGSNEVSDFIKGRGFEVTDKEEFTH